MQVAQELFEMIRMAFPISFWQKHADRHADQVAHGLRHLELVREAVGAHHLLAGETDLKLPITLPVKWADDTPMVSLTDQPIPGLGTFTARVLFFRGQYAGTWSGADHGGHLFGDIVKQEPDESESDE